MKLDPDCIRDILMDLEGKIQDVGELVTYPKESGLLGKYQRNVLSYHTRQCILSGLLLTYRDDFDGQDSFHIKDLSPSAHEFLANIRSETTWSKTKEVAKKVGSSSLTVLLKIAAGVVTNLINTHLGS